VGVAGKDGIDPVHLLLVQPIDRVRTEQNYAVLLQEPIPALLQLQRLVDPARPPQEPYHLSKHPNWRRRGSGFQVLYRCCNRAFELAQSQSSFHHGLSQHQLGVQEYQPTLADGGLICRLAPQLAGKGIAVLERGDREQPLAPAQADPEEPADIPDEKLVITSVKLNQVVAWLSFFWEQIQHFHFVVKMSRHSFEFNPLASPTGVTRVTNPLWSL
jgi:hypothetical protein